MYVEPLRGFQFKIINKAKVEEEGNIRTEHSDGSGTRLKIQKVVGLSRRHAFHSWQNFLAVTQYLFLIGIPTCPATDQHQTRNKLTEAKSR